VAEGKPPIIGGSENRAAMPELPDITVYQERLRERVAGRQLVRLKLLSPFVLRTALPPIAEAEGRRVQGVQRIGKRIVLALEDERWLVIHLMIAGRLRWLAAGAKPPARISLATLEFEDAPGTLVLTEAGSKRRAALHFVGSEQALKALDAGGIDVLAADAALFEARLRSENHTLKRSLTDPRLFSGMGNAYSDEILHRARLSPLALTRSLDSDEVQRLFTATQAVLAEWAARLLAESPHWPEKVTAFHPQMAVHGRFGQPCPVCGSPVQRIVYADNEANYCARCQTGGRLLADRSLSRLLKESWPKHLDEL
jgi:formamidopyrimidine-DNA glycosylase